MKEKFILLFICVLLILTGCEGSPPVKHEGWARVVNKEYTPSGTHWEYTFKPDGTFGNKLSTYPAEYYINLNTDVFSNKIKVEISKELWDCLEPSAKVYFVIYTVDNKIDRAEIYLEQPNGQ
jgi:hypothetical protein